MVQGAAAWQQGGGGSGDQHGVQAAGGGGGDEPQLQGVCAARLEDEERHAGARCGLGQGDGGGGHGVQVGGGGGVHARVKDGFGGEKVKRAYWKKKVIPDGLVQSRINQFSTVLLQFGGGEGAGNNLEFSDGATTGRRRKYVENEWINASAANFRILRRDECNPKQFDILSVMLTL